MKNIDADSGPDSGYPTPRDAENDENKTRSPTRRFPNQHPLTSTPCSSQRRKSLETYFRTFQDDLSIVENVAGDSKSVPPTNVDQETLTVRCVNTVLKIAKELKKKKTELEKSHNESFYLTNENNSLKKEVELLKTETSFYANQSRNFQEEEEKYIPNGSHPYIPKLHLQVKAAQTQEQSLREEFTQSQDYWEKENTKLQEKIRELNQMLPVTVVTASAQIQVDFDKSDAEVQTEPQLISVPVEIKVKNETPEDYYFHEEVAEMKSRLAQIAEEKRSFEQRLASSQEITERCEKETEQLKNENSNLKQKYDGLKERLNKFRRENQDLKEQETRFLHDLELLGFEKDEIHSQNVAFEELIANHKKEVDDWKEKHNAEKQRSEELDRKSEALREEQTTMRKKIEQLMEMSEKAKLGFDEEFKKASDQVLHANSVLKENLQLNQMKEDLLQANLQLEKLSSKLRTTEESLESSKAQLQLETKRRRQTEKDCEEFKTKIKLLEENSGDVSLFREKNDDLAKQIDHLREQLKSKVQSGEFSSVKNELHLKEERLVLLEQKLEETDTIEKSLRENFEQLRIDFAAEKQIERQLREDLEAKSKELKQSTEIVQSYSKNNENLREECLKIQAEFENFKRLAELQYLNEINERDERIASMQDALVQLETYPGKTLSVELREAEVQTTMTEADVRQLIEEREQFKRRAETFEEVKPPCEKSDASTSISEDLEQTHAGRTRNRFNSSSDLSRKINEVIVKLHHYNTNGDATFTRSCIKMATTLLEDVQMQIHSAVATTSRFWDSLRKLVDENEKNWKSKLHVAQDELEMCKGELDEANNDLNKCERRLGELKDELDDERKSLEDLNKLRYQLESETKKLKKLIEEEKESRASCYKAAVGFKEELDHNLQTIDDFENLIATMQQEATEERQQWEKIESDLRRRLEAAQHSVEVSKRDRHNLVAENEQIGSELGRISENHAEYHKVQRLSFAVDELKKEVEDLKRKRLYDGESLRKSHRAYEIVEDKNKQLRQNNTTRQKLLNKVISVVQVVAMGNVSDEVKKLCRDVLKEEHELREKSVGSQDDEAVGRKSSDPAGKHPRSILRNRSNE